MLRTRKLIDFQSIAVVMRYLFFLPVHAHIAKYFLSNCQTSSGAVVCIYAVLRAETLHYY